MGVSMDYNTVLPVLVPGAIILIIVSVVAALALAWVRDGQIRQWVRRGWLAAVIVLIAGDAIFWVASAMVEGPERSTVDRSLQQQQQDELNQRLSEGGH